jgi:hypothetical protein
MSSPHAAPSRSTAGFSQAETRTSLLAELEETLAALRAAQPDLRLEPFEVEDWDEALDTPVGSPLVWAACQAAQTILGKATPVGAPWCSDAPILAAHRDTDDGVGAGLGGHRRTYPPRVNSLDELMLGARLYTELVLAFSNQR